MPQPFFSIICGVYKSCRLFKIRERIRLFRHALYSQCIRHYFKKIGTNSSFKEIESLKGAEYISIGDNTLFSNGLTLTAWDEYEYVDLSDNIGKHTQSFSPEIIIGDNCRFGAWNHITSINRVVIGNGCLTGKWVTITDNSHGVLDDLKIEPAKRRLVSKGEVVIGNNVWIGDKATILPDVHIGDGAIIAANAVVTRDVAEYSVVAGVPAKVINVKYEK